MPLEQFAQWVDAPESRTTYQEGEAKILQLKAHKDFSPEHALDLLICKTSLYEGCNISSKLLPLIVAMWERKKDERFMDFYSFDNNGICLSHGYSRMKNEQRIVDEKHDLNVVRLVEYGEVIRQLIADYPVSAALAMHTTFIDLQNNCLNK